MRFGLQTNSPSYSDAANQCITARNSFFADNTCLNYYRTLGLRPSFTAVNNASTAICASQTCKGRLSSYVNLLITCRVGSTDDDEEGEGEEENTRHLQLAYLIGNTTCRVDNKGNTCYSSVIFNEEYAEVMAAFVSCYLYM